MLDEMLSYAASPSFDELLRQLASGAAQQGAPLDSIEHPLVIGWGRRDRVCFPRQAKRALELFPGARLQWVFNRIQWRTLLSRSGSELAQ